MSAPGLPRPPSSRFVAETAIALGKRYPAAPWEWMAAEGARRGIPLIDEPPRHEQEPSPAQRLLAGLCGVGEVPVAPAGRRT